MLLSHKSNFQNLFSGVLVSSSLISLEDNLMTLLELKVLIFNRMLHERNQGSLDQQTKHHVSESENSKWGQNSLQLPGGKAALREI